MPLTAASAAEAAALHLGYAPLSSIAALVVLHELTLVINAAMLDV